MEINWGGGGGVIISFKWYSPLSRIANDDWESLRYLYARQVSFWIAHTGDSAYAEGRFDHLGGELIIEQYGFHLTIPPGALDQTRPEQISLRVLSDAPDDLLLLDDEFLISCGFQCSPPGLTFRKPVKLTMPHCAIIPHTNKIRTALYYKADEKSGKNPSILKEELHNRINLISEERVA